MTWKIVTPFRIYKLEMYNNGREMYPSIFKSLFFVSVFNCQYNKLAASLGFIRINLDNVKTSKTKVDRTSTNSPSSIAVSSIVLSQKM